MAKTKSKTEKVHCNKCLQKTKHIVVAERIDSDSQPVDEYHEHHIQWATTYTMLECCGCSNVTLRRRFWFSEWEEIEEEYYPPPISRQLPGWYGDLPEDIKGLMKEIYTALHANSRCIALMGARTLVDLFMNHHVGDVGGFADKLRVLVDEGYIGKKDKEVLDIALEAGHAAIHRGHKPSIDQVHQVIDIVENLIQKYTLKDAADYLKSVIPSRKKASSKKP